MSHGHESCWLKMFELLALLPGLDFAAMLFLIGELRAGLYYV